MLPALPSSPPRGGMAKTSKMKEQDAERTGTRKSIFSVRPNDAYYEEKRQIGLKKITTFPFTGGDQYVGEWTKSVKEGIGTQTWVQGHKYEGEWAGNKRTGKGTYWVCEGGKLRKQYTGDWVDDMRHGVGVFMTKDGGRYEGEWRNHKKHGMGKMFYGPGPEVSYNGSWAEGMRSGLGILTMLNGDRFEGHWRDDRKEGPGRFFYKATNKVYEGEWVNNVPRCGSYCDAPLGSFPAEDAPLPTGLPTLPTLRLLGPESIVSEAVADVRQARAEATSELRAFAPSEMEVLRRCFAGFDPEGSGFVAVADLHALVSSAGVDVPASLVEAVVASLEADESATLTFAEVVDVVAILAGS